MAQLDNLRKKCEVLGLEPEKTRNRVNKETGERYRESTIDSCILTLQNYYIEKYRSEGVLNPFVERILEFKPMLAAQMKALKEDEQSKLWVDNNNWMATEKIDGNRMRYCYNENYGVEYFSRNLSEGNDGDYLPLRYSSKLTIPRPDMNALKAAGIHDFIIDTELVPYYDHINQFSNLRRIDGEWKEVLEYPVADTGLSLTTSVLGALDDLSHRMQETNPMKLMAFDIISLNGEDLTQKPLKERLLQLAKIMTILRNNGLEDKIQLVKGTTVNKTKFYKDIASKGGEGCVVKDLNSIYVGKREKTWVKAKRSVSGSILEEQAGDTIDAFIIGFKRGNEGTNIEQYVGAVDFGIYLLDEEGNFVTDDMGMPVIHHIATVSGLTLDERIQMTEIGPDGLPRLKKDWYNKVAEIDGQDVSSKNLRLSHSLIKRWRMDKNADDCQIKKSFLESLIL
ncbi:MAG: ATP-dependent DNA ligase [Bacilli bacterium]|nr:ATP-dependent DNA ligase [Bacilli bacterium]MBQ3307630.1 ATP-dependent DNA ligase [Bacilli bacterium]MBQ3421920.1 ATP-dependent DNA ligase [Romboutsia sp.]